MKKEQDNQKDIDVLKRDNEEMGREIISLKRQIGGYKAANERYRKDLEKCKKEAEQKDKELNEAREAIKMNKQSFDAALDLAKKEFNDVEGERITLKANIEWYNSLPWYKRIFKKIVLS